MFRLTWSRTVRYIGADTHSAGGDPALKLHKSDLWPRLDSWTAVRARLLACPFDGAHEPRPERPTAASRRVALPGKDFHPHPFGPKLLSSVGLGPIRPPVPRNCLKLPQSNISGVLAVMHFSDFSAKSVHSPRPPGAVSPARAARDFFALRPLKTLVFNAFQCTSHHVYEPWDPSLTHLICHPHEHSSEERARNTQVLL